MSDLSSIPLTSLETLDRRWIFLMLALVVALALLTGIHFPDRASDVVQPIFDHLEHLPPGAPILLSLDYSPSSAPELEPMAEALTRHALLTGHPICFVSLWATGNPMITRLEQRIIRPEFPAAVPGREWAALGYQAGGEMLINSLREDLGSRYATDCDGRPLDELACLDGVVGLGDFGLIVSLSSGTPGLKEWILYAGDVLDVPLAGGCTGVGAPQFFPYFPHQLVGLMSALKGAAEYEAALAAGHPEYAPPFSQATDGMGPQSAAHLVIVGFILIGNAGLLIRRWKARR
jgi:hypothetical protein